MLKPESNHSEALTAADFKIVRREIAIVRELFSDMSDAQKCVILAKKRLAIFKNDRSDLFCETLAAAFDDLLSKKFPQARSERTKTHENVSTFPVVVNFLEQIKTLPAKEFPEFVGKFLAALELVPKDDPRYVPAEMLSPVATYIDAVAKIHYRARVNEERYQKDAKDAGNFGLSVPEFRAQRRMMEKTESRQKVQRLLTEFRSQVIAVMKSRMFDEFDSFDVALGAWQQRIVEKIAGTFVMKPTDAILKLLVKELGGKSSLRFALRFILKSFGGQKIAFSTLSVISASKVLWLTLLSKDFEARIKQAADVSPEHVTEGVGLLGESLVEAAKTALFLNAPKKSAVIPSKEGKEAKRYRAPVGNVEEGGEAEEEEEDFVVITPSMASAVPVASGESKKQMKELEAEALAFGFSSVTELLKAREEAEVVSMLTPYSQPDQKRSGVRRLEPQADLLFGLSGVSRLQGLEAQLDLGKFSKTNGHHEASDVQGPTPLSSLRLTGRDAALMGAALQRPETPTGEHPENKRSRPFSRSLASISALPIIGRPSASGVFSSAARDIFHSPRGALRVIKESEKQEVEMESIELPEEATPRAARLSPPAGPVSDQAFPSNRPA